MYTCMLVLAIMIVDWPAAWSVNARAKDIACAHVCASNRYQMDANVTTDWACDQA